MDHKFCIGCTDNVPLCAIDTIITNISLDDIAINNNYTTSDVFVCHKFAQEINCGKLNINKNCDDCELCYITCPYADKLNSYINYNKIEHIVLSDCEKANIFFQHLFPMITIATKVSAKGNFRTKRLDLVIKSNDEIRLIKLLTNKNKLEFYCRSYDDVVRDYQCKYPDIRFSYACLVPTSLSSTIDAKATPFFTISSLCSMLGGY